MADITQWEYKTVGRNVEDEELNKLGEQGWEVTAAKATMGGSTEAFLMKRPKQPQRPAPSDGYGYGR